MLIDPNDIISVAILVIGLLVFVYILAWDRGFRAAEEIAERHISNMEQPRDEQGRFVKK